MRDSANDAFFTAESLENISEALIREGIQNSLDAASRGPLNEREVRVRISLVRKASPQAKKTMLSLFEPARTHFEKGLSDNLLGELLQQEVGYLVFEDFGTKGLNGDVNEWRSDLCEGNAFFSFFRAEGRSSKTGEKLGRWGIGKQVFPTSSKLHAMFGLTVRSDSPLKALMGSAVIKSHSLGEDDYQPDAWYGQRQVEGDIVLPISENECIETFCETFGLLRGDQPGLSILVPCVDDRVDTDDLRQAIVRNFFWPILLGELVVELESDGRAWKMDAETVTAHRDLLGPQEAAIVEFASWASVAKPKDKVDLTGIGDGTPDWKIVGPLLLTEENLKRIRTHLDAEQRVGVKIPIKVRKKNSSGGDQPRLTFFEVYIETCRDSGYRTQFLRDGILIKDVRAPLLQGCRSLVVVDEPAIAGLLGDSEGVNHTQWQKDSAKFYNRYFNGPKTISFVTRSVYEIVQALHGNEAKGDPKLLLDLFFLPSDESSTETKKAPENKKKDDGTPPVPPIPKSKPSAFIVQRVEGGFIVKPGKGEIVVPFSLKIEAAYDVRRGNPIKKWSEDDFVFTRTPLKQEPKRNVIVTSENRNCIQLEIRKPDFEFGITGFDKKRDIVVVAQKVNSTDEENI